MSEIQQNRIYTKVLISIMQAYVDGKKIRQRELDHENKYHVNPWIESDSPNWNWVDFDYDIVENDEYNDLSI